MDNKNLYKLFLILGIGIGLLVSSLLNMAYPKIEYVSYSEEQIIEKARELGMVSLKEVLKINDEDKDEEEKNENNEINEINEEESNTDEFNTEELEEDNDNTVEFVINKGENSEEIINRLYEKGIITDKDTFSKEVIEKNLQKRFIYGVYELEYGMDHETLLKILTRN